MDRLYEALFFEDEDGHYILLFSNESINQRIIVHEAFHATIHLLDGISQNIDPNNHEVYAYTIDYIYTEICKKFKQSKYNKSLNLE